MSNQHSNKAALRGEPSYVWRSGQERRLKMIITEADQRNRGKILVDGCGLGAYLSHLAPEAEQAVGIDVELERVQQARQLSLDVACAVAEKLPYPSDYFDLVLSHEVLEHVQDDQLAIQEIVRTLKPGGRLVLFCPNRGYPFETHGIYRRGKYHFGNIPLVNYLPRRLRDRLAPHVGVYTKKDLERLFENLPVKYIKRTVVFGAYDNIIARYPKFGKFLRSFLQSLEKSPFRVLGLSQFWVVEKV